MATIIPTESQLRDWITSGCENPKKNIYPIEAIDATMAIHSYLYRRCEGNINVLVEHARLKGFNYDYGFFYQLLTARYFRPDSKTGKPQGSWKNVVELWKQLQIFDIFAKALSKIRFVDTSVYERINDYVQLKSTPFNACRFGAVVGHTGMMKTESFLEIGRRGKAGAIFRIESPAQPKLNQFIHKLAHALGAQKTWTIARKMAHIVENVADRVLIIDNVQRCFNLRSGSNQPIFDYLQELQEDTGCTIIICWTPVDKEFEGEFTGGAYFEQFVGRIGGEREILRLEDYPLEEDIEKIALSFHLPEGDVEKLMPRLRLLVREKGRIRALFNALQQGARLATADEKPFRAHHVLSYLASYDEMKAAI
ncbi:MAG TPA: ATP-binding protein [Rariglobus sp.]|jgi:hypothetical protein|nr:ATP-binding protein [Rariglobus sp.]